MKKMRFFLFIFALLVLISGCSQSKQDNSTIGQLKAKYSKKMPYEIQDKVITINDDEDITFASKLRSNDKDKIDDGSKTKDPFSSMFKVYGDADLTRLLTTSYQLKDKKGFVLNPRDINGHVMLDSSNNYRQELTLVNTDENQKDTWGVFSRVYVLQSNDLDTGKKLAKPKLWVVNIKKDKKARYPLTVAKTLLADGRLQLEWAEVPGADSYSIVKAKPTFENESEGGQTEAGYTYQELDRVKSTVYRTPYPADSLERNTKDDHTHQDLNAFESVSSNDDSKTKTKSKPYEIIVVPLKDGKAFGAVSNYISSKDFASNIPDQIDYKAFEYDYLSQIGKKGLPTEAPVLMKDGNIRKLAVQYETGQVEETAQGKYRIHLFIRSMPTIKYDFGVTNKTKTKEEIVQYLESLNQEVAKKDKSGIGTTYVNVKDADIDLKGKKVVRDVQDVNVVIKAKSAAEEYIGKAIASMGEYVDMSKFPELNYADILDICEIVIGNNPDLPRPTNYAYSQKEHIVQLTYKKNAKEQNKLVNKKADEIIKEIIKDGMSDREKAEAINQYLIDHVTYNVEAYENSKEQDALLCKGAPLTNEERQKFNEISHEMKEGKYMNSWDASGALLDGTGVCSSYAQAFQILAKKAGLKSVYVTGTAISGNSGNGHAWNYVQINGKWLAIDVTWNDSDSDSGKNDYLLLDIKSERFSDHFPSGRYSEYKK